MTCKKCGHQLPAGSKFCQYCGEAVTGSNNTLHTDEITKKAFVGYLISYILKLNCCTHNRFNEDAGFYWARDIIERAFGVLTAGGAARYTPKSGFNVVTGRPVTPEDRVYMDLFDILLFGDYSRENRADSLTSPQAVNLMAYEMVLEEFLHSDNPEYDGMKSEYARLYDAGFGSDDSKLPAAVSGPASAQKWETKEELPFRIEPLFQANLPVILQAAALNKGVESGRITLICRFRSLTGVSIAAMQVDVLCFNVWHEPLDGIEGFEYPDLHVSRDKFFGDNVEITLPDPSTRSVEVKITRIVFADGRIVERTGENYPVPKQEPLLLYFQSPEFLKEYREKTNSKAEYVPVSTDSHWFCSCGAINSSTEEKCHVCGVSRERVFSSVDKSILQASMDEKRRQEEDRVRRIQESEAAEAAQAKADAAKLRKIIAIILAVLIGTGSGLYAAFGVIRPNSRYRAATELFENGEYDSAYTAFSALNDFRDSRDMATEALYRKANALLEAGNFRDAAAQFKNLRSYRDSKALFTEAEYRYARELFDSGRYQDAAYEFGLIGDYMDSRDQKTEAQYLYAEDLFNSQKYSAAVVEYDNIRDYKDSAEKRDEASYLYAKELFDAGSFEEAHSRFSALEEYKDSDSMADEAYYQYGLKLLSRNLLEDAQTVFEALGDYQDSKSQWQTTTYELGCQYLDRESFDEAIAEFESLGKYKDSHDQLLKAMYAYVKAHFNNTDEWTYDYLKTLKKEGKKGYKDSAELYKSLYAWKVELVAVNADPNDGSTILRSIGKKTDYLHFNFMLSGGPPNGSITMKLTVVWPDGDKASPKWYWEDQLAGDTMGIEFKNGPYSNTSKAKSGILKVIVYDKATGDKLGEGLIRLD